MLHLPEDLNLLRKLQEATTDVVDEERGLFKKGDKVVYELLGGALSNSDLIRTLGTTEHILRANHDGLSAEIVEAIGDKVARYSIMFEDGFVIADLAASELKSVTEAVVKERTYHIGFIDQGGETAEVEIDAIGHEEAIQKAKADSAVKEILTVSLVKESKTNEDEEDLSMEDRAEEYAVGLLKKTSKNYMEIQTILQQAYGLDAPKSEEIVARATKQVGESKTNEGAKDVTGVRVEQVTQNRWDVVLQDKHGKDDAVKQLDDVDYARKKAKELAKVLDVPYNGVKYLKKESKTNEAEEDKHEMIMKILDLEKKEDKSEADIKELAWLKAAVDVHESKTNEAEDATQTMKPQEKPNLKAEDCGMEDLSDVDLEKAKGSSEESGNAIRPVDDKELVVEPDKVVEPKKESKLKESSPEQDAAYEEDFVKWFMTGWNSLSPDEREDRMGGLFREGEAGKDIDYETAQNWIRNFFDDEYINSLMKSYKKGGSIDEETEFTPSRSEVDKLSDETLRKLYKNAVRYLDYWSKDKTDPERVIRSRQSVARFEELLADRGLLSSNDEKKESRFSFMKKQDPLWLCNECFKTFRNNKSVCAFCESKEVERITEQVKEVFKVTWKNTDTGKEESTSVMAFDKAAAKKEAARPNREVAKVEGPIMEEPRREAKAPFDKNQEGAGLQEGVLDLVGEVPGIDKEEVEVLRKALEGGSISNEWPTEEQIVDILVKAEIDPHMVEDADMEELRHAYLKHILLTKAMKLARTASESKVDLEDSEPVKGRTYHLTQKEGVGLPDGDYEVGGVSYRWTARGDLVKHFQIVGDDKWWIAGFYGFKASAVPEAVRKPEEVEPMRAIEIVRSQIDPEAYNIRVVELPEGSVVILDSVSDKEKAIERGKELARQLNAKFLGVIDEKKIVEMKCPKCGEEMMEEEGINGFACATCGHVVESKLKEEEELKSFRVWYKDPSQARLVKMKYEFMADTSQEAMKAARMLLDKEAPGNEFEIAKSELTPESEIAEGKIKEQEEVVDLLGLYASSGNYLAFVVSPDKEKEYDYWLVDGTSKAFLDNVPIDIARKLGKQGSPNQEYRTGFAAADAAAPYVRKNKDESKLKEQEEEDTFQTIAKGMSNEEDAERLAKEKEGQVIQDEEDKTKFAVVVRSTNV